MRKRIKVLITVFAVAAMCFAFTACGGEDMSGSPYVGTWTATSASYAGMEMSISDLLTENSHLRLKTTANVK